MASPKIKSSGKSKKGDEENGEDEQPTERNEAYVARLLENLKDALDEYMNEGSSSSKKRAQNIVRQIERESQSEELIQQATSMYSDAASSSSTKTTKKHEESNEPENATYIRGLLKKLQTALDKYILTGSPESKTRAQKIVEEIQEKSQSTELVQSAIRMALRAELSLEKQPWMDEGSNRNEERRQEMEARKDWGNGNAKKRKEEAEERQDWEKSQKGTSDLESFARDKAALEESLVEDTTRQTNKVPVDDALSRAAAIEASALVASAGAGSAFEGQKLGIGGLDSVLAQVKRRVWVPLAAPPELLQQLGINPVRGLLLYGRPGCGKTLVARTIGKILSPARPVTVVSGPELMDKFVGSSEKNLREVFDNPPDIYDSYRIGTPDGGATLSRAALHVIVMDEFDAMARTRGGRGGKGDQGDAGVARDSVVNQLLAKMDGVDPLEVPTLVIGLTNKRSLIEPALLRPGRFEVQIEVPPPKTVAQRMSILLVHTKSMYRGGRLLVSNPPDDTAASRYLERNGKGDIFSYEQLLRLLAAQCKGMSGAMMAGVARAAASHALERAVCDFSGHPGSRDEDDPLSILNCLVTLEDFELAVKDVMESSGDSDWEELSEEDDEEDDTRDLWDAHGDSEEAENGDSEEDRSLQDGYTESPTDLPVDTAQEDETAGEVVSKGGDVLDALEKSGTPYWEEADMVEEEVSWARVDETAFPRKVKKRGVPDWWDKAY